MKKIKDLYIIGAGALGREVAWLVNRINQCELEWNLKGFLDDNVLLESESIEYDCNIVGNVAKILELPRDAYIVCAIGNTRARKKIIQNISQHIEVNYATLVDPSVIISEHSTIGVGSIICAGSIVSVNVNIEKHSIIDWNCTIGHDDIIENYVTIYPGVKVSGNVLVNECVELGTGSSIIQGKQIGQGSFIGAGAVVIDDIPEQCTAVGVPARPIKFYE